MTRTAQFTTTTVHDVIVVDDAEGGRWFPSDEAAEQIAASSDPEAEAIRLATEEPMRGEWRW